MNDKLKIRGVNLDKIRNRNEVRVAKMLETVLDESLSQELDPLDIEDIYALALNRLPARYTQRGSIVLREEVSEKLIRDTVLEAFEIVRKKPSYSK